MSFQNTHEGTTMNDQPQAPGLSRDASVSERDAVLRERAAAIRALAYFHVYSTPAERDGFVRNMFPLPKISRPRVVTESSTGSLARWRVTNGELEWSRQREGWSALATSAARGMYITAERAILLADLLANPTEEVEDDGSAAPSPGAGA